MISRVRAVGFYLLLCLFGCGGGGGGSTPAPGVQLAATFDLSNASPSSVGVTRTQVDAVLDTVFTDAAVQTALVVKRGYVVGERYATGFTAADLGTSWSVAKSIYGAAIGIAIDEGFISSLDQPASDFLDEWVGTNKEAITIRDLLEMRGGLPADSAIFFDDDQTEYALNLPLVNTPGTTFVYSNPTSQLIEPLLLRATGVSAHAYLSSRILDPLGITGAGLWFDRSGINPMTYCCIDMTVRDFARFGLLFSRGGSWESGRILSSGFVNQSLTAQSAFYGLQWWILNDAYFGRVVSETVAAAQGLDGQRIYVWPEADVVVVVLTQYSHSANQGYVLSDLNFPDTCTARNSCPDGSGIEVPFYDEFALVEQIAQLD